MKVMDAVMTVIIRMLRLIICVDSLSVRGGTRCPVFMRLMIWMMTVMIRIMTIIAGDDRLSTAVMTVPVDDR